MKKLYSRWLAWLFGAAKHPCEVKSSEVTPSISPKNPQHPALPKIQGIMLMPGESRRIAIRMQPGENSSVVLREDMACPKCGTLCIGEGTLENHNCEAK